MTLSLLARCLVQMQELPVDSSCLPQAAFSDVATISINVAKAKQSRVSLCLVSTLLRRNNLSSLGSSITTLLGSAVVVTGSRLDIASCAPVVLVQLEAYLAGM